MDISYILPKNDFWKNILSGWIKSSNSKAPVIINFYWVPSHCAEMIWYSFYTRTDWVIAADSGFLNNWATTFESTDSSWKMLTQP